MEKSVRYLLPRLISWSRASPIHRTNLVPLQLSTDQSCAVHYNRHLALMLCRRNCSSVAATHQQPDKPSFGKRMKLKLRKYIPDSAKLAFASNKIYASLADDIDASEFFRYFEMPDTFQSWFLVIHLHVWMVSIRVISERDGKFLRNKLIEAMWQDVEMRLGRLQEIPRSLRKESLRTIYEQFQAETIAYDEGLFSDDTVLAATVWRTFFNSQYRDPRLLESMVAYIRKQMAHLDTLNTEELILRGVITWMPLKDVIIPLDNKSK